MKKANDTASPWMNAAENAVAESILGAFGTVIRYAKKHEQGLIAILAEDIAVHLVLAHRAERGTGNSLLGGADAEQVVLARRALRQSIGDVMAICRSVNVEEATGYVDVMAELLGKADGVLEACIFEEQWEKHYPGVTFDPKNKEHKAYGRQIEVRYGVTHGHVGPAKRKGERTGGGRTSPDQLQRETETVDRQGDCEFPADTGIGTDEIDCGPEDATVEVHGGGRTDPGHAGRSEFVAAGPDDARV